MKACEQGEFVGESSLGRCGEFRGDLPGLGPVAPALRIGEQRSQRGLAASGLFLHRGNRAQGLRSTFLAPGGELERGQSEPGFVFPRREPGRVVSSACRCGLRVAFFRRHPRGQNMKARLIAVRRLHLFQHPIRGGNAVGTNASARPSR